MATKQSTNTAVHADSMTVILRANLGVIVCWLTEEVLCLPSNVIVVEIGDLLVAC